MKTIAEGMGRSCDVGHREIREITAAEVQTYSRGGPPLPSPRFMPPAAMGCERDSAANSQTALGDFNGFLKDSIIEKPPGVVG
jgi:hypothetical protein